MILSKLREHFRFQVVTNSEEAFAKCPLCQPKEKLPNKFLLRLTKGDKPGLLLFMCRKCGSKETSKILETAGVKLCELFYDDAELLEQEWASLFGERDDTQYHGLSDASFRNTVYSQLLAQLTPAVVDERLKGVEAKWGYRWFPVEEGARAKLASRLFQQFGDSLFTVPGFVVINKAPTIYGINKDVCYLIPCRNTKGEIECLKGRYLHAVKDKMTTLSSTGRSGPSSVSLCHVPLGVSLTGGEPLRIVEGEKKADICFHLTRVNTVGIPGVGGWKLLIPVLEQLKPSRILLAFDKDTAGFNCTKNVLQYLGDKTEYVTDVEHWRREDDDTQYRGQS